MSTARRLVFATPKFPPLSGKWTIVREQLATLHELGWEIAVTAQVLDRDWFDGRVEFAHRIASPPFGRAARLSWFQRRATSFIRRTGGLVLTYNEGLPRQDAVHVINSPHLQERILHEREMTPERETIYARMLREVLAKRAYQAVVAPSKMVERHLVEDLGVDPAQACTVYMGHDPVRFRPDPSDAEAHKLRRELLGDREGLVVGLVTSGDFVKRGVEPFVKAFARARAALGDHVVAVVVGKERHPERWQALARNEGLGDSLRFLEPRRDVESIFRALDLYVHAAPFEEFGITNLEALACGVPLLCSRWCGVAEVLPEEGQQMVLSAIDVELLADGMQRLLGDRELLARMAAVGREAGARYTWEHCAREHAKVYEPLLG